MGGIFNKFESEGITLDSKRKINVLGVDYNISINKTNTKIIGESIWGFIDVPKTYGEQYGTKQFGLFVDVVQTILETKVLEWEKACLNVSCRFDYVDWNVGDFEVDKTKIGEELFAITPSISFRPTKQSVLRLNYRFQSENDILNNPSSNTGAWLFGFSTYF